MSYFYSFLVFFTAFFLQTGLFGNLRPFGFVPNFILVTVFFFGLKREIKDVLPFVFILGFFLDLLFGKFFGFHMILLAAGVWLANFISKDAKVFSLSRIIFLTAFLSLAYSIFLGLDLYLSAAGFNAASFMYLAFQIGVNLFAAFLLYGFSDKFFDFLEKTDNFSKQKVN